MRRREMYVERKAGGASAHDRDATVLHARIRHHCKYQWLYGLVNKPPVSERPAESRLNLECADRDGARLCTRETLPSVHEAPRVLLYPPRSVCRLKTNTRSSPRGSRAVNGCIPLPSGSQMRVVLSLAATET